MPCGRGWVVNSVLKYEQTTMKDRDTLIAALVALGFDAKHIEDRGGNLRISGYRFDGLNDLAFTKTDKGYSVQFDERDQATLDRLHRKGFLVGLKTQYSVATIEGMARTMKAEVRTRTSGNLIRITARG